MPIRKRYKKGKPIPEVADEINEAVNDFMKRITAIIGTEQLDIAAIIRQGDEAYSVSRIHKPGELTDLLQSIAGQTDKINPL